MKELLWTLIGIILTLFAGFYLYKRDQIRRKRRLAALTAYLESAVMGKDTTLSRVEDEFSILEDELYKTVSELRIAKEQALKERELQADNLADIAHQIKTPLTSMSLMTQLLMEIAAEDQKECIQRISSQLSRLEWLTASLLMMSRLDAKTIVFTPAAVSFEELAFLAAESLEQVMYERGQTLIVQGGDCTLFCDAHWTAEALVNLLKNCSEHTPKSGDIILAADITPLYSQITVEDSGLGFEHEDIPKLFRRFYRGKNAGKDSIGIGLALCRSIVERQGGIICAENRSEGGARFIIRFY